MGTRRARRELRILVEDLPLELLELRSRLEAELFAERSPGTSVDVECVALSPRAVEGTHQLSLQPLA
jgi:hypothetical protein